jgi:hypothetical protein
MLLILELWYCIVIRRTPSFTAELPLSRNA